MEPSRPCDRLLQILEEHGDPATADRSKRYLKSDLEHLGVRMPDLRRQVGAWVREVQPELETVAEMWQTPIFEARMSAVIAAERLHHLWDADSGMAVTETWIRTADTWALVDPVAINVAGPLLGRAPGAGALLDRWAIDDDFWIRRSALLTHLTDLRRGAGDFDRFSRYADAMLDETEFFIRKAIGWVLRDTGRRRPDLVFEWFLPRAARASGVTTCEVMKVPDGLQADRIRQARGR